MVLRKTITGFMPLIVLLFVAAGCRSDGPPPPQGEPQAQARVSVAGTGLYKVEPATLASLGWTAGDPLTLTLAGETVPFQTHEDAIYFYVPDTTPSRYSAQHTLWLTHGEKPESATPPDGTRPVTMVVAEQRLSGQEIYNPKYVGDPWFWLSLAAPASETHQMETPGRVGGAVTVLVRAAGITQVDHELGVQVNGQEAGTLEWSGTERHEESFTLDLPAGETLDVSFVVAEQEQGLDMSMLDEVVVRYPSQPIAREGFFKGSAQVAGVASFEQLGANAIGWQLEPELASLSISVEGSSARVTLPARNTVVVMDRTQADIAIAEAVETRGFSTEGADYVAIVAPALVEAVEPLLEFHRENGLRVLLLTPQEIYDGYSEGEIDPLAFRALLSDAIAEWTVKPRFVLLVGDSTYDPHGYQSELPATYLPSPFIDTVFGGETVSDNVIADVDEDGYPDVALGRLPAQSAEQLTTIVDKIIAYSQSPADGDWRQRVLLTADGQEDLFKQNSEALRQSVSDGIEIQTIYPEEASDAQAQLLPALNSGSLLVNYVGHGSVQQWGRDQLLTAGAASDLSNGGRLPIFINMTCLTGLFSHPSQESLAESLLWAKDGGAIAAVAPSSLTLPTNQSQLNGALVEALLSPNGETIGEALMHAKQGVPLNSNNDVDIVATFNLLGDPALRPALSPALADAP